jgi:ABC-2 type transport system ATP-binding protein
MSYAVRTYDLTKVFRHTPVLTGISLAVPEGSIYGLVGPNGAGKTTTIKVLMNIFPPTSGRGEVLGADSRRLAPRHFAQIGYVSENQEMPDWMTVGYFLDYLAPFYPTWDHALAAELVRQFQLPLDVQLKHLSRGMRMKASLASSLAGVYKILRSGVISLGRRTGYKRWLV